MNESPIPEFDYISRSTDGEVFTTITEANRYVHIASPPQTGKTRLLEDLISRLEREGIHCALLSNERILEKNDSESITEEDFYSFVIHLIAEDLNIDTSQPSAYASFRNQGKNTKRHLQDAIVKKFIEEVVFREIETGRIVIAFDNIDKILNVDFTEARFASKKSFQDSFIYNFFRLHHLSQFSKPSYKRLSFVTTSSTNFSFEDRNNIFTRFSLGDFQEDSLRCCEHWLTKEGISLDVLDSVINLTNGHPGMTVELLKKSKKHSNIDALTYNNLIPGWRENTFSFLRESEKYISKKDNQDTRILLKSILEDTEEINYKDSNVHHNQLIGLGLASHRGNKLFVHNEIVRNICKTWQSIQGVDNQSSQSNLGEFASEREYADEERSTSFSTHSSSAENDTTSVTENPSTSNETDNSRITSGQPKWLRVLSIASIIAFLTTAAGWVSNSSNILAPVVHAVIMGSVFVLGKLRDTSWDFSEDAEAKVEVEGNATSGTGTLDDIQIKDRETRRRAILISFLLAMILVIFSLWQTLSFLHIYSYRTLNYQAGEIVQSHEREVSSPKIELLQKAIVVGRNTISTEEKVAELKQKLNRFFPAKLFFWVWGQPALKPYRAIQEVYDNIYEYHRLGKENYKQLLDVHISSEGKIAAVATRSNNEVGGAAGQLLLWSNLTDTGRPIADANLGTGATIAFSNSGKYLISASGGSGKIKIYDVSTQAYMQELSMSVEERVKHLEFSDSDDFIVATYESGAVDSAQFSVNITENSEENWNRKSGTYRACLVSIAGDTSTSEESAYEKTRLRLWSLFQNEEGRLVTKEVGGTNHASFDSEVIRTDYNPNLVRTVSFDKTKYNKGLVEFGNTGQGESSANIYIARGYISSDSNKKVSSIESIGLSFRENTGCDWISSKPEVIREFSFPVIGLELGVDGDVYVLGRERISLMKGGLSRSADILDSGEFTELYDGDYKNADMTAVANSSVVQKGRLAVSNGTESVRFLNFGDRKTRLRNQINSERMSISDTSEISDLQLDLSSKQSTYKLAVLTTDGLVSLHTNDLESLDPLLAKQFGLSQITTAIWDRNNNALITGHNNGSISSWRFDENGFELQTRDSIESIPSNDFENDSIVAITFGFPAYQSKITAISSGKTLRLYLKGQGEPSLGRYVNQIDVKDVSMSPTTSYLITTAKKEDKRKRFEILAIKDRASPKQIKLIQNDKVIEAALAIAWYPKKRKGSDVLAALIPTTQNLCLWEISSSVVGDSMRSENPYICLSTPKVPGYSSSWNNLEFSEDGKYMILASSDDKDASSEGEIFVFEISNTIQTKKTTGRNDEMLEKIIAIFRKKGNTFNLVKFNSDNKVIVSGQDGHLEKLNIGNMREYITWSCEWLKPYIQTHLDEESSKACEDIQMKRWKAQKIREGWSKKIG